MLFGVSAMRVKAENPDVSTIRERKGEGPKGPSPPHITSVCQS